MNRAGRDRGVATCGEDGIWLHARQPARAPAHGPALFLDRDGTIVEEVGHLRRAEDVRLIAGAARVIATANARAIPVVVVTNQSGIGRGLFDWPDFQAVEDRIATELSARGATLDAVLACPFHSDARPPYRHPDHPARKPNPGMLLRAARVLGIDLALSWIIGDRCGDIAAGRAAGLAGGIHVATGWGLEPNERDSALACAVTPGYRVLVADDIAQAASAVPFLGSVVGAAT